MILLLYPSILNLLFGLILRILNYSWISYWIFTRSHSCFRIVLIITVCYIRNCTFISRFEEFGKIWLYDCSHYLNFEGRIPCPRVKKWEIIFHYSTDSRKSSSHKFLFNFFVRMLAIQGAALKPWIKSLWKILELISWESISVCLWYCWIQREYFLTYRVSRKYVKNQQSFFNGTPWILFHSPIPIYLGKTSSEKYHT